MDAARVYVPLQDRGFRALSRETGLAVWSEPVDVVQPPLVDEGQLLIVLPEQIRALDPLTGRLRWSLALARPLSAALTSVGGVVILVTDEGDVMAMRSRDGEIVWRRSLGSVSRHAPAPLGDGSIVLTLADGRVIALRALSGDPLWERALPGALSAPATARDRVFVGSTNNFFYALDADTGDEVWKWRTGGDVIGAAADGDRVYFAALDNILRAVNRDNGNQLWKAAAPTRPSAPPIAFGDVVVLAGVAPRFDAYDGKTGAALGSFTAPAELRGAPLIDTSPKPFEVAIVVLTMDGGVTALRPTKLMFPDPPLVPLPKLPGRELPREKLPSTPRLRVDHCVGVGAGFNAAASRRAPSLRRCSVG